MDSMVIRYTTPLTITCLKSNHLMKNSKKVKDMISKAEIYKGRNPFKLY